MKSVKSFFLLVILVGFLPFGAYAVPIVYSGWDVGSGSLATSPLAVAAANDFDTAAGPLSVIDFESSLPADFSITGSGTITNTSGGSALYGYNTTVGGSYFYYLSGGVRTFNFTSPIDSFGAYFTGFQIGTQTITYTNGDTTILNMPGPTNMAGGTVFFGFIDAGASISSISYNAVNDIVAVDDIRYGMSNGEGEPGQPPSRPSVPEPATMLLFGTGLVGLVGARRKLKK